MGMHADDARDEEEMWEEMWWEHKNKMCSGTPDCPFCDPDFIPFFTFQCPREE